MVTYVIGQRKEAETEGGREGGDKKWGTRKTCGGKRRGRKTYVGMSDDARRPRSNESIARRLDAGTKAGLAEGVVSVSVTPPCMLSCQVWCALINNEMSRRFSERSNTARWGQRR